MLYHSFVLIYYFLYLFNVFLIIINTYTRTLSLHLYTWGQTKSIKWLTNHWTNIQENKKTKISWRSKPKQINKKYSTTTHNSQTTRVQFHSLSWNNSINMAVYTTQPHYTYICIEKRDFSNYYQYIKFQENSKNTIYRSSKCLDLIWSAVDLQETGIITEGS